MSIGRKALYKGEVYAVVSDDNGTCDLVENGYEELYHVNGLDLRGSGLSTMTLEGGEVAIIDNTGTSVGYSDVPVDDLTFVNA
jgi:hypothetical protein